MDELIITLLVGFVAGAAAGYIVKMGGMSWFLYIIIGVVGSLIGRYLFSLFSLGNILSSFGITGLVLTILQAVVGAILLLLLFKAINKKKS